MRDARTDDLLFDVAPIIEYASTVISLQPAEVILTGTTGGVGHTRDLKVFLKPGDILESEIESVGLARIRVVADFDHRGRL